MEKLNVSPASGFAMIGELMGEIAQAYAKVGANEDEMKAIKAKIEGGEKLTEAEIGKVKGLVDAMIPAFERLATKFGDDGKALGDKFRGQFETLLSKI
jgi:hypothetical protein